jgi:DsbC/DsbD-like thiol-disulfide interchange protein
MSGFFSENEWARSVLKSLALVIASTLIAGCDRPMQDVGDAQPAANVAVDTAPASSASVDVIPIGDPSREDVVVVAAAIFPPQARPGDVVTLAVRFRTAIGWHFFAVGDAGQAGPVLPTTLDLELPPGVSTDGDWALPEPDIYDGPTGRGQGYEGDVTFRRRLRIDPSQSPGVLTLPLTVSYQACDESVCVRPGPAELRPTLELVGR